MRQLTVERNNSVLYRTYKNGEKNSYGEEPGPVTPVTKRSAGSTSETRNGSRSVRTSCRNKTRAHPNTVVSEAGVALRQKRRKS